MFFKVSKDVFEQIQGKWITKLKFLGSIGSHYFLKLFGIEYTKFPPLKIKVRGCVFSTRKDTIDFWMLWKGYEEGIFTELDKRVKPNDTFVDVGANIGTYSVTMAKKGLQVYSFEPIRSNFDVLERNISDNGSKESVIAYNLALGDKARTAEIIYNPREHGEGSLVQDIPGGVKEEVNVKKLDDLSIKPRNKCFMKIDVEGFEYQVLLGAENFIRRYKPSIIIEI